MAKRMRKGKREAAGMAKAFDFQMLFIYVMYELTVQVASTITTSNFT